MGQAVAILPLFYKTKYYLPPISLFLYPHIKTFEHSWLLFHTTLYDLILIRENRKIVLPLMKNVVYLAVILLIKKNLRKSALSAGYNNSIKTKIKQPFLFD